MTRIGNAHTEVEIAIRYSDEELFGEDANRLRSWAYRKHVSIRMKQLLLRRGHSQKDVFQEMRLFTLKYRPMRDVALSTAIVKSVVWSISRLLLRGSNCKHNPPRGTRTLQWSGCDVEDKQQAEQAEQHEIDESIHRLAQSLPIARLKQLIHWRYGLGCDEKTLKECGKLFGITRERCRQLEEIALHRMRCEPLASQISEQFHLTGFVAPVPPPRNTKPKLRIPKKQRKICDPSPDSRVHFRRKDRKSTKPPRVKLK